MVNMTMKDGKDDIESALQTIDEDYIICFKMIRKIFNYLETFGVKEFNKYSKYKWNYDRDKSKGYNYVCIRYGTSLSRKCLVKRRAYVEDADLYKWVDNKELIKEAMDEAYEYIYNKVNDVKTKIEKLKGFMEDYGGKLDEVTKDFDEAQLAGKELREEPEDPEDTEKPKRLGIHQEK